MRIIRRKIKFGDITLKPERNESLPKNLIKVGYIKLPDGRVADAFLSKFSLGVRTKKKYYLSLDDEWWWLFKGERYVQYV
jgi:hypothetical protein